jgi:hypothetical protein
MQVADGVAVISARGERDFEAESNAARAEFYLFNQLDPG